MVKLTVFLTVGLIKEVSLGDTRVAPLHEHINNGLQGSIDLVMGLQRRKAAKL